MSPYRNPISPKRLEFLRKYLRQRLHRLEREKQFLQLESKLRYLDTADPSPSGEYSRWMVDQLIVRNIDFPEDSQKLFELLQSFHRVKSKLPVELRDINKYDSYGQLRKTLLPMLPELKSRAELQREGTREIAEDLIGTGLYQIYELLTPQAASTAAKNTGWCTCNEDTAEEYLSEGPLYLIVRNDERFALAHEPSHQVMDINDMPLQPTADLHHYDEVVQLFRKYLPQFICRFHPLGKGGLRNIGCKPCEIRRDHPALPDTDIPFDVVGCAECGWAVCEHDWPASEACDEQVCPRHASTCGDCKKTLCPEHVAKCCSEAPVRCERCTQRCRCEDPICDSCATSVDCCDGISVCEDCAGDTCVSCNQTFCSDHSSEMLECGNCSNESCLRCIENGAWQRCNECDQYYCKECVERCDKCQRYNRCPSCGTQCEICGEDMCERCSYYCRRCKMHYCEDETDQDCDSCGHNHLPVTACEFCEVAEGEDEQLLCEKCVEQCYKCTRMACGSKHSTICGCGRRHSLCVACEATNVCTVCHGWMCNPEEHMMCAYVRRRRYG